MGDLIYLAAGAVLFLALGLYGRLLGRLQMIVALIYGAAALGVAIYMVVALLRPETF